MTRKLGLLLAAVAVIALAVPALASAAPQLTIGGKAATKGQTVTGTSTNWSTQTSLGLLKCESVVVNGLVNENTGTTVDIGDDGESKGTGCKVGSSSIPMNLTLTTIHISSVGKGTFSLDFTTQIGAVHCSLSITGGTFTYTSGGNVITLTNADFVGTPAACEPATVNGSFTLTSTSGVIILH